MPRLCISKICLVLLVVLLLHTLATMAQQPSAPANPASQQSPGTLAWLDHPRISTFSLGRVVTDDISHKQFFAVVGTAVFIGFDEHTAYIVTAKHLFFEPEKNWHPSELLMRFAWQEDKSVFDEFGIPLRLRDISGKDLWTSLDDGSDLAAIAPPPDLKNKSPHAIGIGDFATNTDDLYMGASIVVLGYPGVVGNQYLVRPVLRQGIVAWTNPTDPLQQVFMIDANVYPGNSGSPVFRIPTGLTRQGAFTFGGKAAFLGILSQGPIQNAPVTADGQPISLQAPGQLLPSNHPLKVQIDGIGGIGIIEPASKVLALVQSLRTKK